MAAPNLSEHDPELGLIAPCPCHTGDMNYRDWPEDSDLVQLLVARHGKPGKPAPWFDHPYRLWNSTGREWVYVVEPYELGAHAFEDFAYLDAHGWRVEVTAWRARHFPGHTLAVLIYRS